MSYQRGGQPRQEEENRNKQSQIQWDPNMEEREQGEWITPCVEILMLEKTALDSET